MLLHEIIGAYYTEPSPAGGGPSFISTGTPMTLSLTHVFFAPCPRGLESVLADELHTLQARDIRPADGGVSFAGDLRTACQVNLWSRIASRVLWRVGHSAYRTEEDIYQAALRLDWPRWFGVEDTLRVKVDPVGATFRSAEFVTLKIKDAICDRFRAATGQRPSVDTRQPDVRIHAYCTASHVTFYLDTSGEPLFKRGYRSAQNEAPLRENLAAGLLALSGWTPDQTLLDPMCGSGTLLLEAVQISLNRAPGLQRGFGFERLKPFSTVDWPALQQAAQRAARPPQALPIFGADKYGYALKAAQDNLAAARLGMCVQLKQADFINSSAPAASGVLVTNPPYGVRLMETGELDAYYPQWGHTLKQHFSGWRAYFLSGDPMLAKRIRLSASKKTVLFNGPIECRLLEYRMVAGSNRRDRPATPEVPA